MGDRAVFGFKADSDSVPVFLYSHWGGSDRYRDLQRAVEAARPRWCDPAYATRIAISQIIENYWNEELGFGISAGEDSFCQPDYDDVLVVNWAACVVNVVSAGNSKAIALTIPFEEFLSPAMSV